MHLHRTIVIAALLLMVAGCVTDIAKTSLMEPLDTQTSGRLLLLQSRTSMDLPRGYSADDLSAESTWRQVGTIPQGDVLAPSGWIYQVKAGPLYDADLVVHQNGLVGIYIPSKSAFVVTDTPACLTFTEVKAK